MNRIFRHMNELNRRLIAPIGGEITQHKCLEDEKMKFYEPDIKFICRGHTEMAKCLGLKTDVLSSNGLEYVVPGQINSYDDIEKIVRFEESRKEFICETARQVKEMKSKNSDKLVGGGCFGPLTVAGIMVGVDELLKKCIKDPEFIQKAVSTVNDFILGLAKACESAGADFIWIAEPNASIVSPKMFRKFSGVYLKALFSEVSVPIFLHVCGDTTAYTKELVETGARCLSLDSMVDMREMAHMVPRNVMLMGNIDPVAMKEMSRENIELKVSRLSRDMKNFKNFIMSSGCSIPEGTPEENVKCIFDSTRRLELKDDISYSNTETVWRNIVHDGELKIADFAKSNNISQNDLLLGIEEACTYILRQNRRNQIVNEYYNRIVSNIINAIDCMGIEKSTRIYVDSKDISLSELFDEIL